MCGSLADIVMKIGQDIGMNYVGANHHSPVGRHLFDGAYLFPVGIFDLRDLVAIRPYR
jgi:hypothetical protein